MISPGLWPAICSCAGCRSGPGRRLRRESPVPALPLATDSREHSATRPRRPCPRSSPIPFPSPPTESRVAGLTPRSRCNRRSQARPSPHPVRPTRRPTRLPGYAPCQDRQCPQRMPRFHAPPPSVTRHAICSTHRTLANLASGILGGRQRRRNRLENRGASLGSRSGSRSKGSRIKRVGKSRIRRAPFSRCLPPRIATSYNGLE